MQVKIGQDANPLRTTSKYSGYIDDMIRFIEGYQLMDRELWHRFVLQYQEQDADADGGWKGEFWGKMMRGACFTYAYTRNSALYEILEETVIEMMSAQDDYGRISTYDISHELECWDLWCRKYVLLGMQYFIEICKNQNLVREIITSMKKQVDAIMDKIGPDKKPITYASKNWRGLNACSILEPIVRLYRITGEEKYLGFARYIVGCGGTSIFNVIEAAYEDKLFPYQYPITKAYELTSFIEGVLEYYYATGEERYRSAVIKYADKLLESDFTVIGSAGCTHELLDHSSWTQANTPDEPLMQETCVTVTLMKFFYRLNVLTGDAKYVDAFERSMYNAYFGSINTEKQVSYFLRKEFSTVEQEALPFDSYSPLTTGTRGQCTGGIRIMSDNRHYGCCACIGSAGNGLIPMIGVINGGQGITINLFIPGKVDTITPSGQICRLLCETSYPRDGTVSLNIELTKPEKFALQVRNPAWSKHTKLLVNGTIVQSKEGYFVIDRIWSDHDRIELLLDMTTHLLRPVEYKTDVLMNHVVWREDYVVPTCSVQDELALKRAAIVRGPITFAADESLGWNPDEVLTIDEKSGIIQGVVATEANTMIPFRHMVELLVPLKDGSSVVLVDYGSVGKQWENGKRIAVWIDVT